MVKIRVDGKFYNVNQEKNLLEACLAVGLDIPHFCFHPALGSVGACRLCAVKKFKDPGDTKGRIVMSCMEPVTEGLIISIGDEEVKAFRASVIEGLMTNHPHDCPVCDEGGECHLQDMTIMSGHNYRRFDFPKRTYNNQDLGPFINHEMNRCIQCYRCVRFYRDYAGGRDLNVFGSGNHVYFGRFEEGILENEFSGNLVEVCPTGVFTDKTLKKHFTRKWDLSNTPSICVHCSVGCNTIASERYGSLRRIMSRYNGAVNGYFICDRGRFGYEFVNDEKRITKAEISSENNENEEVTDKEKLNSILKQSLSGSKKILGIGSSRASLESNYALSVLVGKDNFYHGISKKEQLLTRSALDFIQNSGVHTPSLKEIEKADAIFILGEDITNTAPMIALALRQAVRNVPDEEANKKSIPLWNDSPVRELTQDLKSPVFIATPKKDGLDDIAIASLRASYGDISSLGFAVASLLDKKAPDSKIKNKELAALAEKIAHTLRNSKNPLIISGINCNDEGVLHAAFNISLALRSSGSNALISIAFPECNSFGLGLMHGKSLDDAVLAAEAEDIDALVILEVDLIRKAKEENIIKLLGRTGKTIVLDHLKNYTTSKADILLPAATFAESTGTIVNNEGRAQRYYKAIPGKGQVKDSWQWLTELNMIRNNKPPVAMNHFDEVFSSLIQELPIFSKLKQYSPDSSYRMLNTKMPRQTIRYSGRTAINANIAVSEKGVVHDPDSPLEFSMEGQNENPPSSLIPFYWTPGWNSVQAMYDYMDEPNGSLRGGDPGIRILEPSQAERISYYSFKEETSARKEGDLMIVPVYRIFGSEELSSTGQAILKRIEGPYIYMNRKDAGKKEIKENDQILIEFPDSVFKTVLKFEESFPEGTAGLSVNLPGMPFFDLPAYGLINKL